jgi:predicted adenine nucleotide alpha hydrolase (AANH) superfamily ATPase
MTTLLHICCGPCATATIDHWRGSDHDLVGFFHNPNIQPLLEFRRRLEGARDLAAAADLPLVEDLSYDPARWFADVGTPDSGRCRRCIGRRMERAALEARAQGCDAFTTSLAISPWQDHDAIREEGARAAASQGIAFLYEDLRPLYRESRRLARRHGLYRQAYCGCVISEWERYRDAGGGS